MNFYKFLKSNDNANLLEEEKDALLRDYTYLFFRKFILSLLPIIIERTIKEKKEEIEIEFNLKKCSSGTYEVGSYNIGYWGSNIILEDFILYFSNIPNVTVKNVNNVLLICRGNIKDFVNFYYESLQEEKYHIR